MATAGTITRSRSLTTRRRNQRAGDHGDGGDEHQGVRRNDERAAATPTVTAGAIQTGDTANFTEAYVNKNVGTANKTVIASGAVTDGNGGNNYAVTLANNAASTISARAITVTAVSDTKTADGTTSSSGVPTISPALVGSDTSGFIQTFDTAAAGTGKTLTPSGSAVDGNSGNNYNVNFQAVSTGTINPGGGEAGLSVLASPSTVAADGSHTSTITVTLKDTHSNPVSAKTVSLAHTSGGGLRPLVPPPGSAMPRVW